MGSLTCSHVRTINSDDSFERTAINHKGIELVIVSVCLSVCLFTCLSVNEILLLLLLLLLLLRHEILCSFIG
jgi:diacylglycerol kinase